jgi:type I restriction enzyme S subunit
VNTVVDWFGKLPEGWRVTRLKNVIETTQVGVWGDEPRGDADDVRCVRVADFDRPRYAVGSVDTVRSVPAKDRSPRLLKAGDILLEKSGGTDTNPVGFCVMFSHDYAAVSSNFISRIRIRESESPRFWLYALAASYSTKRTERSVKRTTGIQNLDQTSFFGEEFPVPPSTTQRAIADYLDRETARIDTLIEEQQRLIEMLRERRSAAISAATGWTDRPPGWPMKRLSWLFETTASGTTPANEDIVYSDQAEIPWVTTGELREARITFTQRGVTEESLGKYSALRLHPPGSLLIAMYGATIGRLAILDVSAASNQACCALIGPQGAFAEFVQFSLLAARELLLLEAAGGGQPNINQDTIRTFRIPLPPLDEQRRIAAYLDEQTAKIDALIAETETFIELSRERRSALITAAVTGQIDVRGAA